MRIISKFHDYYDIGMSHGQDASLTYVRNKREIILDDVDYFFGVDCHTAHWTKEGLSFGEFLICFCGQGYPGLEIFNSKNTFIYNIQDLDEYVKENFSEENYNSYLTGKYNRKSKWEISQTRKVFDDYFGDYSIPGMEVPVKVITPTEDHCKIVENEELKKYEFFRVVDPFSAYQRISMFLGGLAAPNKAIPEMSNDIKIQQAGFNLKTSFRKGKNATLQVSERYEEFRVVCRPL